MITAMPYLMSLELAGLVQTRESGNTGWKVRNTQHPEHICLVTRDGTWHDASDPPTGQEGVGILPLCDYLRLDRGAVLDTLGAA